MLAIQQSISSSPMSRDEAIEQFNDDPFNCLELMAISEAKSDRRLVALASNEATYSEYEAKLSARIDSQFKSSLADIVNNDWSDSGRAGWINKWCQFVSAE